MMKIYASFDKHNLDNYIDKDVWIKVDIWDNFTKMYCHWYAKVLKLVGSNYYLRLIPEYVIDSGTIYNFDDENSNTTWVSRDKIKIADPIEVLTNAEIVDMAHNEEDEE